VGIVGDVRQVHLDRPAAPELYTSVAWNPLQLSELGMTLVVRTRGRPEGVIAAVRSVIHDVDPDLAVFGVRTMERVVADSLADFTLYLRVVASLAALALLLAITGTYGVISFVAVSRAPEFAMRVALGADAARVIRP
jgi:hypothetical protein